jgi:integrase/recombinase XerD
MHCDPFTDEQIPEILAAMGEGSRNKALFALGLGTGLRVSELLQIRRKDLVDELGVLRDRVTVYHAKGDKVRTVPINALATPYLKDWLICQQVIGQASGKCPVFCGPSGQAVTRKYVWQVIRAAARKAKIRPQWGGAFGTHSMRKTFARAVYLHWQERQRAGEDAEPLVKVQEALGHANIDSTRRYLNFMLGRSEEGVMALYPGLRERNKIINVQKPPPNGIEDYSNPPQSKADYATRG